MVKKEEGFTLIELLVTLLIGSFIMGSASMVLISQSKAYATQEQVEDITENLRSAVEMMTRDIRLAGYQKNWCNL
jgi:type IV pilus assembly protein PilW